MTREQLYEVAIANVEAKNINSDQFNEIVSHMSQHGTLPDAYRFAEDNKIVPALRCGTAKLMSDFRGNTMQHSVPAHQQALLDRAAAFTKAKFNADVATQQAETAAYKKQVDHRGKNWNRAVNLLDAHFTEQRKKTEAPYTPKAPPTMAEEIAAAIAKAINK
jgi:hypothetical protein